MPSARASTAAPPAFETMSLMSMDANVGYSDARRQQEPEGYSYPAAEKSPHASYMQTTQAMGVRIKTLRVERGETQAVVAEAVGIERPSLSMIERGHDRPGLHTLRALADYFGVTLDYLERGSPLPRVDMSADAPQSLQEAELLNVWRRIGDTNQALVVALMEQLSGLGGHAVGFNHAISPQIKSPRKI